jgi:hypothetical protein
MRLPTPALVDSGADSSMFPLEFAHHLGIDLGSCRREECRTAGGSATQHIWEEGLDVVVQGINRTIHLGASFSETTVVLLGRADFFQAFRVSIDHRAQRFRLEAYEDD